MEVVPGGDQELRHQTFGSRRLRPLRRSRSRPRQPYRRQRAASVRPGQRHLAARLLDITGEPRLLAGTPALLGRLSHRNPWVDPLNHLQVELLERVRGGAEQDREPLLATISGIAAGLRNTG